LPARIKTKPALVADHDITYAEAEPWLAGRDRPVFEKRFATRLRDPAFRSAVLPNLARYPLWDRQLNPTSTPRRTRWQNESALCVIEEAYEAHMEIQSRAARDLRAGIPRLRLHLVPALQANAREEILQNARLMMESALSARNYTIAQVKPLLDTQMKYVFLPQTVPAYAATEQFNELRKKHPDLRIQGGHAQPHQSRAIARSTGKPTSSTSSATRRRREIIGERDTPTGRSLYLARPDPGQEQAAA
jgi:hypothetical protein